jgi:hypothetical protein
MPKSTITKALRAIASALDDLEQHELDALAAGRGRLIFVPSDKPQGKSDSPNFDVQAIVGSLNQCENREDAQRLLAGVESKDRLVAIAKALKVHVVKHDRREDIENKVIAFAIGSKLRTEAIQSLNLRGGSPDPGNDG